MLPLFSNSKYRGRSLTPCFFGSLFMVETHQLLLQILSLIKKYTQDTLKWQLFQIFFMALNTFSLSLILCSLLRIIFLLQFFFTMDITSGCVGINFTPRFYIPNTLLAFLSITLAICSLVSIKCFPAIVYSRSM